MNEITARPEQTKHTKRGLIASLKSGEASTLRAVRAALEERPSSEWIAGRVATLLAHGYQSGMDSRVAKGVARDWIMALRDFPQWAIEDACDDFLRTETCRVVPAHIVSRCVSAMTEVRSSLERQRPRAVDPAAPPPTQEQKDRVNQLVERLKMGRMQ